MDKKAINCLHCQHYYNTWDPKHPRGCRLFKFKGPYFPSVAVERETGESCHGFKENGKAKRQKSKMDLNSEKYWS